MRVSCLIDVQDYEGERVIFTFDKCKEKMIQHPELGNNKFLKNLETTLRNPEQVWQDYEDPKNKRCYYRKCSTSTYVKVVIWVKSKPRQVITAYETNIIKEGKYPKLKQLK